MRETAAFSQPDSEQHDEVLRIQLHYSLTTPTFVQLGRVAFPPPPPTCFCRHLWRPRSLLQTNQATRPENCFAGSKCLQKPQLGVDAGMR